MMTPEYSSSPSAGVSRAGKSALLRVVFAAVLALAIPAGGLAPAPVRAQTGGGAGNAESGVRIGIVDMASVLQRSDAILALREAIDRENKNFESEIARDEIALREAERELIVLRDSLEEEEFSKRRGEFETRVVALQRRIQSRKAGFDRSYAEAQGKVEQELLQIVSDIAGERNFGVVLERKNAVLFNTAFDISDEALRRLNERTRNFKITYPRKQAEGGDDDTGGAGSGDGG